MRFKTGGPFVEEKNITCPKCGRVIDNENLIVCTHCGEELHPLKRQESKKYGIFSAYRAMFAKMFDFHSRSGRGEYWYAYLANFMVSLVFASLLFAIYYVIYNNLTPMGLSKDVWIKVFDVINYLSLVYSLVLFIPQLSLTVRRLHDTNRSAVFAILLFAAPVGSVILTFFLFQRGTYGSNRYGMRE